MNVCYFVIISPFENVVALPLNKLESPLHKDALCQVWMKLEKKILNFAISLLPPLEKRWPFA